MQKDAAKYKAELEVKRVVITIDSSSAWFGYLLFDQPADVYMRDIVLQNATELVMHMNAHPNWIVRGDESREAPFWTHGHPHFMSLFPSVTRIVFSAVEDDYASDWGNPYSYWRLNQNWLRFLKHNSRTDHVWHNVTDLEFPDIKAFSCATKVLEMFPDLTTISLSTITYDTQDTDVDAFGRVPTRGIQQFRANMDAIANEIRSSMDESADNIRHVNLSPADFDMVVEHGCSPPARGLAWVHPLGVLPALFTESRSDVTKTRFEFECLIEFNDPGLGVGPTRTITFTVHRLPASCWQNWRFPRYPLARVFRG
jgi:hypothetical protein